MKNNLHKASNILSFCIAFFFDLLFPKNCIGCGKETRWICDECKRRIIYIKNPFCPKCNRLSPNGKVCRRCRDKSYLTGLIVAAYYNEGPLKEAIHAYKYEYIFGVHEELGKIITEAFYKNKFSSCVIIPIPLHKKRQTQRGFNQSELLAKYLSSKTKNKLLVKKLVRLKNTEPQIELSGRKRRENIKDAFSWKGKDEIINQKVLLIDDVYTTGSTLEECAKVLKSAGAKEIWGIVLAKV